MAKLDGLFLEQIICYKSLTDSTFLSGIVDYIKPIYFTNKDIRNIFTIIKEFFDRRNSSPSLTDIKTYLSTDELKKSFKAVVSTFQDIDKNLNIDELTDNTEKFLKEKAVYYTMLELSEIIDKKEVDSSLILQKFEAACNISLTTDIGLDLYNQSDRLVNYLTQDVSYISTGWPWLDSKIDGGWLANGRALYIYAGEPNIGKSIFLGNAAVNIAKQGKTVLLVSLEMPEFLYAKRIAANVTKISISKLREESANLKSKLDALSTDPSKGRIIIKEFPPSTITVNHLRAYIQKLVNKGIKIDAVVLDYVNLLNSTIGTNSYERIKYSTEQLRALTYIFNIPFLSATQFNRSSVKQINPGLEGIAESMGLAMTADVIMNIWQEEEDRPLGIIHQGLIKNRFGPNLESHAMRIDYSTMTITEDENVGNTVAMKSAIDALIGLSGK
jgi:replicative DNA helicase